MLLLPSKTPSRYLPKISKRGGNNSFVLHELQALQDMADWIDEQDGEREDEEWVISAMKHLNIKRSSTFQGRKLSSICRKIKNI